MGGQTTKFKVGDRVRVIAEHEGHPLGYEYVIEEIFQALVGVWYRGKSGIFDGVPEHCLELVEDAKPKFKYEVGGVCYNMPNFYIITGENTDGSFDIAQGAITLHGASANAKANVLIAYKKQTVAELNKWVNEYFAPGEVIPGHRESDGRDEFLTTDSAAKNFGTGSTIIYDEMWSFNYKDTPDDRSFFSTQHPYTPATNLHERLHNLRIKHARRPTRHD